jgi:hypothetical protein
MCTNLVPRLGDGTLAMHCTEHSMHCDDNILRILASYDTCIANAKPASPNLFCARSGCARRVVKGAPYFPACSRAHLEVAGLPGKSGSLLATLGAMGDAHLYARAYKPHLGAPTTQASGTGSDTGLVSSVGTRVRLLAPATRATTAASRFSKTTLKTPPFASLSG